MAAPTQQYPPWLTPVPSVFTDANGVLTTTTEVLYLPLTYYGPSIPLDSDWTYGGLTPPASTTSPAATTSSTPTQTVTETTPITTSPATPSTATSSTATPPSTSLSIPSTSTATPTSSSTISLSPSVTSSITSSISPSSSSIAPTSPSKHTLSQAQRDGIIVGSVLGLLFIILLVLLICLCRKGPRTARDEASRNYSPRYNLNDEFVMVGYPEESAPRPSGGETDPFLQRNTPRRPADPEMGGRPQGSRAPAPAPGNNSLSSSGSSTNHSGYGTVIERPTLNLLQSTREELASRRGPILSPDELHQIEEEEFSEKGAEMTLVPPPRIVDPSVPSSRSVPTSFKHQSSQQSFNPYSDADEPATVFTARRVRVGELATRSTPWLPLGIRPPSMGSSGFLDSLRRLSWFNSGRNSRPLSLSKDEDDVEAGKSLLGNPEMAGHLRPGKGLTLDPDRPVSAVSAHSGATVFFDAISSPPSTPTCLMGTPPTPLPRALTPSGLGAGHVSSAWPANIPAVPQSPPAYSICSVDDSTDIPNLNHGLPSGYDVLDIPAPPAVTHFTSNPSMPSLQHTKSVTSASASVATYPAPPGLTDVPPKVWTDTSSSIGGVAQFASRLGGRDVNNDVSVDVLEQDPPAPGEPWRHLAEGVAIAKRTTFGQPLGPGQLVSVPSEEDSLSSMRSPFSGHTRSTGSAPASRRAPSSGSSSPRTGSGGAGSYLSLVHSSSISSDARRRRATSPMLSVFGGASPPMSSLLLAAPTAAHFEAERAAAQRFCGGGGGEEDLLREFVSEDPAESRSLPGSPSVQLVSAPWAAGLGESWVAF